ncbi:hypothetical protein TNIN_353631 [Trichonephila inaurata madagascariensis]|uniref:Uncharacterized protein n=1 Tax=Trichonephila inaurata madagascariensis TaxID=2747483 RepID=A0A8X7C8A2_9ARAC|nr:hypothetical protein TNIN_353631 [Trichonephila inaurata madagascariensis]
MPEHPSDVKFINNNWVSFALYRSSVSMDVENAGSEKSAKSEVHSRVTERVFVPAESWQRRPAAAARRCGFVTFFPSRHDTAPSPPERSCSVLEPPFVS